MAVPVAAGLVGGVRGSWTAFWWTGDVLLLIALDRADIRSWPSRRSSPRISRSPRVQPRQRGSTGSRSVRRGVVGHTLRQTGPPVRADRAVEMALLVLSHQRKGQRSPSSDRALQGSAAGICQSGNLPIRRDPGDLISLMRIPERKSPEKFTRVFGRGAKPENQRFQHPESTRWHWAGVCVSFRSVTRRGIGQPLSRLMLHSRSRAFAGAQAFPGFNRLCAATLSEPRWFRPAIVPRLDSTNAGCQSIESQSTVSDSKRPRAHRNRAACK
jgi:hypothetical protein